MIYITGDTHGEIDMSNCSTDRVKGVCKDFNCEIGDIKYAIILGDFGVPWNDPFDDKGNFELAPKERFIFNFWNTKPYKVLAVMGNHDNYDAISKMPEVDMFGDKVRKVSDNIFYLERGHVYTIEGKKFLAMGGAQSIDVAYRTPHLSWWSQEQWNLSEMTNLMTTIKNNPKVDYVISHTGPWSAIKQLDYAFERDETYIRADQNVTLCDTVEKEVDFECFYFGHWHIDNGRRVIKANNRKYTELYHEGIII